MSKVSALFSSILYLSVHFFYHLRPVFLRRHICIMVRPSTIMLGGAVFLALCHMDYDGQSECVSGKDS